MKINWGTKLVFFALLFMAFIVTMVVIISKQDVPLVEEGYYEKGIRYQEVINTSSNEDSLTTLQVLPNEVKIENSASQLVDGKMKFYRPDDPSQDAQFEVHIEGNSSFSLPTQSLKKGKWKLEFSWKRDTTSYLINKDWEQK